MRLSTKNPTPKIDPDKYYHDTDQTYSYYSYDKGRTVRYRALPYSVNGATSALETLDFYVVKQTPKEVYLLAWGTQEVTVRTNLGSTIVQVPYFLLYKEDEVHVTSTMTGVIGKTRIMQDFTIEEWVNELDDIFLKAAAEYAREFSSGKDVVKKSKN